MLFLRGERLREKERSRDQREREENERKLLEQRLVTQEAEREALALKSQIYANIGIMAGSYAHNIKNMMVRPGDLIQRVLKLHGQNPEAAALLTEVQQSMQAVAERTQQILKTVRSYPAQSQPRPVDLNELIAEVGQTWSDLAAQKWRVKLTAIPAAAPLFALADRSHLQQALENLVFNARDATFEKRASLREAARVKGEGD